MFLTKISPNTDISSYLGDLKKLVKPFMGINISGFFAYLLYTNLIMEDPSTFVSLSFRFLFIVILFKQSSFLYKPKLKPYIVYICFISFII